LSFNTTMSKSLFSRIAVFGLFVLAWAPSDAQVVQVGQGSYTTVFPGVDAAGRNSFPSGTIDIYPNPSRGRFTVSRESQVPAAFRVQNLSGQVLMQGVWESDQVELNLERLPAGMYVLNVNQEGHQSSYKLVIMH
jgi:hypothetical protein